MTTTESVPAWPAQALAPLPLSAIRPLGWLRDQIRVQADGLSGHLDEFWPSVADSKWIGGGSEGWERGPYWLDGIVPPAILLDDTALKAKAQRWMDYILDHQHPDGWLGVIEDSHEGEGQHVQDPWPIFVLLKAMTQWQEATGDARIIPAMQRDLRRINALRDERPLESWAAMPWFELSVSLQWLWMLLLGSGQRQDADPLALRISGGHSPAALVVPRPARWAGEAVQRGRGRADPADGRTGMNSHGLFRMRVFHPDMST